LFPYSGGSSDSHLIVYGTCSWVADADYSWITIDSGGSGVGMNNIDFTVDLNTGADRYGTITVTGRSLILNQAGAPGCTYIVSPAVAPAYTSYGGSGTFSVSAVGGCNWTASSPDSWIMIYMGASGSGNGTVAYLVLPNDGIARNGTLTIEGQTLYVHQDSGCTYALSYDGIGIASTGGTPTVGVSASDITCAWTATSNDTWITINSGSNGTGSGAVTYTVAAYTGSARTGTMTIEGQTFTVNQGNSSLREDLAAPVTTLISPAIPGNPFLVTINIVNNTGGNILTIRPDCVNTNLMLTDAQGNIVIPNDRLRGYAAPADLVTIGPGNYPITCDLFEAYSPSAFTESPQAYTLIATYANMFTDPNYAMWTGVIPSGTQQVFIGLGPVVGSISVPVDPVQIGSTVAVSASFTDPGAGGTNTHSAMWNWDGTTSAGTVNENTGIVTGSHTYSAVGVYDIALTVTDSNSVSGTGQPASVVVYDPSGSFVTGGGWINSPVGAYRVDTSLIGKATFGFVSKYKKGATVPTGETEFQFKIANLNFHSDSYQWLVVAGIKAQYKGVGTINGAGNYGFILTAIDGQIKGGGGTDKFRIKIWDKNNNDNIIYDNQINVPDDADPTTVIGGGSIIIHK
jgi:hypothetical protein